MTNGALIQVLPKTLYNFGYIGDDETDDIIVARALNVIPYDFAYLWIWYWPNDNSFGGRPTTLNNTIWFRTVYSQGDERSRGISMLHELMHDSMSGRGLRDWRRDYCDGGGRTTAGGKCYSAAGHDFGAGHDASCGVLAIRCRNPEHACSNIPNYVSWLDFRLEAGWRGWPPDTEVIGIPAFNTTDPAGEWVPDPVADPPFFDDPTPEQFIALVPETADWWEEGEFTPSSGDPSETGVECDEHALANNPWTCH